jgi:amidase
MQPSSDITLWSASSLSRALAVGELSSQEIVEAHIAKIDLLNPSINAIVQLPSERALDEARDLDRTSPQSRRSTLQGLPFTVKDNFEIQGVVTAIGMPERKGVVSSQDAALVRHVRGLGGILLAKSNCPPGGGGLFTENDVYGRTNNPYDLSCTPGGSSGGGGRCHRGRDVALRFRHRLGWKRARPGALLRHRRDCPDGPVVASEWCCR